MALGQKQEGCRTVAEWARLVFDAIEAPPGLTLWVHKGTEQAQITGKSKTTPRTSRLLNFKYFPPHKKKSISSLVSFPVFSITPSLMVGQNIPAG